MLTELRVRNLALIEAAELELGPGLTVLSGETGAGKTALISSLKLLIGERGDSTMVGPVGNEARVEAAFTGVYDGEDEDSDELEDEDTPSTLQEHLVVRRISDEGRSRCYLDDSLVTVGKLNKALGPLVDLYGQHEHQSLLKPREQLRLLDEFGGANTQQALAAYQQALHLYQEACEELQELKDLSSSSGAEREQAAFILREVEKIAPQADEYEELEAALPRLQHGEQLAEAAERALGYLRGEQGVLEKLAAAVQALEDLRGVDTALDEPLEQIINLHIGLEEASHDISRYASSIEYDPEALQLALDRLGELDGLSRRFGPGMDAVFALVERSERLLQSTEDTEELILAAEKKLSDATQELKDKAAKLTAARSAASREFLNKLNTSIASLALEGASLEFTQQELPFVRWGSAGPQSYELLYRPAPAAPAAALAKIASGGELSRVMLGIKSLLQQTEKPMTLVFDEIDAGIGGKTAHAVASRLSELAANHQVIVITHLAQIAAHADRHYLVSKTSNATSAQTSITLLEDSEREEEIARMLSGTLDTEALNHARKLLEEALR